MNFRVLIKTSDVLNSSNAIPMGVFMGLNTVTVLLELDHVIFGLDILLDPTAAVHLRLNSSPAIAIFPDGMMVARDTAKVFHFEILYQIQILPTKINT